MIFTQNVKTGIKDIGKKNTIKNRALLEILENVGSYHSDKVGYGALNIEKTKLTWILLEWKLKVIKRPIYGQTLTINTWGRNMEKFFTYRDYEIYDENNNLCVIATSKWALIDIEMGKMTGFEICEKLIDIDPFINVIFLTAYSDYALDAWSTGACGFMLKPLMEDNIRKQLKHLRHPL